MSTPQELRQLVEIKEKVQELAKMIPKLNSFESAKIADEIKQLIEKLVGKPDPFLVFKWAKEHNVQNPFDMGPKNWRRCLYDLGYPGGENNELEYVDGKLKYQ